jgi:hypothetical protein
VLALLALWMYAPAARAHAQEQCPAFDLADAEAALESVAVVLVAEVTGSTVSAVTLKPVVYLKGAASGASILLTSRDDGCAQASFETGSRVLAALPSKDGDLVWPGPDQVFEIDAAVELAEHPAVVQIRDVTAQFAFPAETVDSGAGIDWGSVILPLGAALLAVFGISFVLMIYWHRIDPS